jgi:hypothetical protein
MKPDPLACLGRFEQRRQGFEFCDNGCPSRFEIGRLGQKAGKQTGKNRDELSY